MSGIRKEDRKRKGEWKVYVCSDDENGGLLDLKMQG